MAQVEVIRTVTELPALVGLIRQLLQTPEVSFLQDQVPMKPAFHGSQVSWHQDSGYWMNIEPWLDPPAIVTCWVAIDNVTEDNDCVRMVPGSHRHGFSSTDAAETASCTYKASTSTPPDLSCSHAAG